MASLRKNFITDFTQYQELGGKFYTTQVEYDAAELAGLPTAASQDIIKLSVRRATLFDEMVDGEKAIFSEATVIQLDYLAHIGDEFKNTLSNNDAEVEIGNFKYGGNRSNITEIDTRRANRYSPEARDFLRLFGATGRGLPQRITSTMKHTFPNQIGGDQKRDDIIELGD